MISQLYNQLQQHLEERQTLSSLRKEVKEESELLTFKKLVQETPDLLINLLYSEDAKTRKNAALLMGDLKLECFAVPLWAGYQKEETRFVKSSYLSALKNYDCSSIIEVVKQQLKELTAVPLTPENKKHIEEEIRALTELVVAEEGIKPHTFCGYDQKYDCILLTNRLHIDATKRQIELGKCYEFPAGVRVVTEHIEELLHIRTYSELLFVVPGMVVCPADALMAAKTIAASELLLLLSNAHEEPAPFYFRIDLKTRMDLSAKSSFAKKISSEVERLSGRELINSTSNYEFTIRMIETKTKEFNCLISFHTIPDERFSYRKEFVASSIKPVNAALLVELAKEYMIDNAQVLDPFCGVGTMLIERQMVMNGNTSYGIDTFPEAIEKAKVNTAAAGQIIHYVNRNCFDFTHEYKFDEIFTNMPFATAHKSEDEIFEIYEQFFPMAKRLMTSMGTIVMYTHNPEFVHQLAKISGYKILEEIVVMDKEGTALIILKPTAL